MAANGEEDLDLLLSFGDRVLETPPGSPRRSSASHPPGYDSDDGSPRRHHAAADMSVFRCAVKDYMDVEHHNAASVSAVNKSSKTLKSSAFVFEKFSGLRIRNLAVSEIEMSNHFSDVRFINLSAIRNSLAGDTISGHWATVGVLTEKGTSKLSSSGKNFCVWKMGSLSDTVLSVFLFGDAFKCNSEESAGAVFAFFNSSVRKDGKGISLSVFSAGQVRKLGISADFGICSGKRKDGKPCTMFINKRQGSYCKYHMLSASQKYSSVRAELKGGNLMSTFRPLTMRGIHMVDPLKGNSGAGSKSAQPIKVLSVDGLKRVLSKAGKVTTKSNSQGIRFLSQVTVQPELKKPTLPDPTKLDKRPRTADVATVTSNQSIHDPASEAKRSKIIELEVFSSDDDS